VQAGQFRRGLDATKLRASIFQALDAPTVKPVREKEKNLANQEAETEEAIST
jgi:hypothetical protein